MRAYFCNKIRSGWYLCLHEESRDTAKYMAANGANRCHFVWTSDEYSRFPLAVGWRVLDRVYGCTVLYKSKWCHGHRNRAAWTMTPSPYPKRSGEKRKQLHDIMANHDKEQGEMMKGGATSICGVGWTVSVYIETAFLWMACRQAAGKKSFQVVFSTDQLYTSHTYPR